MRSMDKFIAVEDELSARIQEKAAELYQALQQLNADELGMPAHCLAYFKGSHAQRLFFSIETSAALLYRSIQLTGKPPEALVLMDYGAGVGTLYTLAKMIGCQKVIYNDHLEDWQRSAQLIAEAIGVHVDEYLVGDIEPCLQALQQKGIHCQIITSRNVVEHIYQLQHFFACIKNYQPQAISYNSTTANIRNPASRLKHIRWHQKWEKVYRQQRLAIIAEMAPAVSTAVLQRLATLTRGMALAEIREAVTHYLATETFPAALNTGSNTCDPYTGVWAEHLLNEAEYRQLIDETYYSISFKAGFWDTHYTSKWKQGLGKLMNGLMHRFPRLQFTLAPFIYIVVKPR